MSGLELLRALREQGEHMATVILTAQGSVETAAEAIKLGADEYLTKPVDLQRLRILLAKISEELRQCIEFTARRSGGHWPERAWVHIGDRSGFKPVRLTRSPR